MKVGRLHLLWHCLVNPSAADCTVVGRGERLIAKMRDATASSKPNRFIVVSFEARCLAGMQHADVRWELSRAEHSCMGRPCPVSRYRSLPQPLVGFLVFFGGALDDFRGQRWRWALLVP